MTAPLENVQSIDIEEWLTLNTAASPTKLTKGQTPDMKNAWVDEKPGSIITANGFLKVGTVPSNLPPSFCINYFKTAAGTQTFVVSDNATVWTTVDFINFTTIISALSQSFQLRGKVVRDKLWLTNGTDAVRVFDGTTVTVLDGSGGTPAVPKGRFIEYHDERVWLYHTPSSRSLAYFSSLTDSSGTIVAPDSAAAWSLSASNNLQISEGDADFGTGMIIYRGYLHFFKQYSIWRLTGYDEYTYTRVKTRASTGTRFNESVQILDSLVHLIGIDGIYVFDGEETDRISDIIDPATAAQTAFGFNQLQQPNQNNQFWETTLTADWNLGNIPTNIAIDDSATLIPVDSSVADFNAGAVITNIDYVDGGIRLSRQVGGGGSSDRVGLGLNAYLDDSNNGANVYGDPSYMTDGDRTRYTGLGVQRSSSNRFVCDLSADQSTRTAISQIIIRGVQSDTNVIALVQVNTGAYQAKGTTVGTWSTVGSFSFAPSGAWSPRDVIINFPNRTALQISIFLNVAGGSYQVSEIEAYQPPYQLTGQFVSKTHDFLDIPGSTGVFIADFNANGEGVTFFTQTSADGIAWDAAVPASNGAQIGSTVRRYFRWGANFTSSGATTALVVSITVNAVYFSAVHYTGGNIFSWGPLEADYSNNNGYANFYYRGATSSVGVSAAAWNQIRPGGVINIPTNLIYVQFKIEIGARAPTFFPSVNSVTVNWTVGVAGQTNTLQNVASTYWRNRYWLSATGPGATQNNTILIRGKKSFQSPWQLKDWPILSFTRYQDNLYGCSSIDGSIYRLDTGYSIDGSAMDSYFETGDFLFSGFYITPEEFLVEVEQTGNYSMTVGVSVDRGNTWVDYPIDLTPGTFATSYVKRQNLGSVTTDRIRFRFMTNGVDTPFEVHRFIFYYQLSTARGSIRS